LNQDRYGKYKVYTTAEIDEKLKNFATYQGVLDMLRAYDLGNCGFMEVPRYSDLNSTYGLQYRQADSNGDGVTTGIEWASSMGSTCLYGFRVERTSAPEGVDYVTSPIGCAGGPTLDNLRERVFPQSEEYLICSATKK
jgi:hypothetical protein